MNLYTTYLKVSYVSTTFFINEWIETEHFFETKAIDINDLSKQIKSQFDIQYPKGYTIDKIVHCYWTEVFELSDLNELKGLLK